MSRDHSGEPPLASRALQFSLAQPLSLALLLFQVQQPSLAQLVQLVFQAQLQWQLAIQPTRLQRAHIQPSKALTRVKELSSFSI